LGNVEAPKSKKQSPKSQNVPALLRKGPKLGILHTLLSLLNGETGTKQAY
jgi:hypothetical protein